MRALKSVLFPIHPEGYRFIGIFAVIALLLFLVADFLGWIGVILTLWCAWFFRDPARVTPQREGLIISPCDGVVNMITEAVPPAELGLGDEALPRISVFMNVFNCHVNRAPIAGKVTQITYHHGKFLNASLDKASEFNERNCLTIETPAGAKIGVIQIAGLVARRIVCFVKEGDERAAGERFGLIRFGSRLDVFLPVGVQPLVPLGTTAVAGETILADLSNPQPNVKAVSR